MADTQACGGDHDHDHDHNHSDTHAGDARAATSCPPLSAAEASVADPIEAAIKELQRLQNHREETHFLFARGFGEFITDGDFDAYKQLAHEVTEGFKALSADVLAIKTQLEAAKRMDLAEMVQNLQEAERDRLHLTTQMQILTQQIKAGDECLNREVVVDTAEQQKDLERRVTQAAQKTSDIMEEFKYELE